jgi:hypothetical protein
MVHKVKAVIAREKNAPVSVETILRSVVEIAAAEIS